MDKEARRLSIVAVDPIMVRLFQLQQFELHDFFLEVMLNIYDSVTVVKMDHDGAMSKKTCHHPISLQ